MTSTFKSPETDIIGCRFPVGTGRNGKVEVNNTTKEYFYKLLPGVCKPRIGDFAVVSCQTGFQVCVVTSINALTSFKRSDLAFVVGFVDVQRYNSALERIEMREHMHKQLMQKKKELEESVTLDLLAERSPEFKDLLEAYRALED